MDIFVEFMKSHPEVELSMRYTYGGHDGIVKANVEMITRSDLRAGFCLPSGSEDHPDYILEQLTTAFDLLMEDEKKVLEIKSKWHQWEFEKED